MAGFVRARRGLNTQNGGPGPEQYTVHAAAAARRRTGRALGFELSYQPAAGGKPTAGQYDFELAAEDRQDLVDWLQLLSAATLDAQAREAAAVTEVAEVAGEPLLLTVTICRGPQ